MGPGPNRRPHSRAPTRLLVESAAARSARGGVETHPHLVHDTPSDPLSMRTCDGERQVRRRVVHPGAGRIRAAPCWMYGSPPAGCMDRHLLDYGSRPRIAPHPSPETPSE